ncbi:MAG: DUF4093 domain-containing protein [Clostridia bacterium]|nr:DUF4093 domain-containing protein [Clostridia bacterium]
MIRIREAIVVEGKYDSIKLQAVVDTLIVETNGFGIFKDKDRLAFLRRLAAERGLIILTDSDSAGMVIRNHLGGAVPPDCVKQAYIPPIVGKERRKAAPSKEGLLGVEGIDGAVIEQALRQAGATVLDEQPDAPQLNLTTADLFELGLCGQPHSAALRQALLKELALPAYLSTSRLLQYINTALSPDRWQEALAAVKSEKSASPVDK